MKNITKLIMLTLLLGSNTLFAQLVGKFNHAPDRHIYFYLTNLTGYHIPVAYGVSNFEKNEHRQYSGVMLPYGTFMFGLNMNWRWEKGEVFIVVYQNGQTAQWTCPETDTWQDGPSLQYKDLIAVTVDVSKCKGYGGSLCSCKVYKGYKYKSLDRYYGKCTNYVHGHQCGHGPKAHGLSE